MKLCGDIDLISFFRKVKMCEKEVTFCSGQGDILNLKSTLSQYLFASLVRRNDLLQSGQIVCGCKHDEKLLEMFLVEDRTLGQDIGKE